MAITGKDLTEFPSCHYCGMDRVEYAHSRIYMTHTDSTIAGVCSLHCAAVEIMGRRYKVPKVIMVGDYNTKDLIGAESAYWVIGGDKMGVMTKRAKWAFKQKKEAEKFIKEHGGELTTFDLALKASFDSIYEDEHMIREKRKM